MNDRMWDVLVVGLGPAGLGASWEASRRGAAVLAVDENEEPGGQLRKQTHRFFGGAAQAAGTRGYVLGRQLADLARKYGTVLAPGCTCAHLEKRDDGCFLVQLAASGQGELVRARQVIVATGAEEKALAFPGWTLPGVMGAGAAQTLINLHRVRPGSRALVVGGGNVGLIVGLQLLQAGIQVVGVVDSEAKPRGYEVHARRLRRAGVPMFLGHKLERAWGVERVEGVEVKSLGPGEGKHRLTANLVLMAVGMSPSADLARLGGAGREWAPGLGGWVPRLNWRLEATLPGLRVAGDAAGVEEASIALEQGRLAGQAGVQDLGYPVAYEQLAARQRAIVALRGG